MQKASNSGSQMTAERKPRSFDNADRLNDAKNRLTAAVQKAIDSGQSTQVCLTVHLSNGEIRQSDVRSECFTRYA
jgi:hypothetical protein